MKFTLPTCRPALPLAVLASALIAGPTSANELADAAERGDRHAVQALIGSGADPNGAHGDGMSALHWAAENGDVRLAEMLLYAGARADSGTRIGGYTPLHLASRNGHAAVVTVLLAAGADQSAETTNTGATPLHLAAASPSTDAVRALLDAGTEVDSLERSWGQTPLIFAASAGRTENVRLLLGRGADPAITTNVLDTAVMERADDAADKRLVAVLAEFKEKAGGGPEWLPEPGQVQGAIAFSRDIQRNWPNVPDPACEETGPDAGSRFSGGGLPEHCDEQQEEGENADVGSPAGDGTEGQAQEPERMTYGEQVGTWGGLTALLHAVRQGHTDTAVALLEGGADINQVSAGDHTSPLLMAAVNGQFDLALLLLERGADPNLLSVAGAGPLFAVLERQWAPWAHYAHPVDYQRQQANHLAVLAALLDAGADPNVRLEKNLWYAEFTSAVLPSAGLHYDGATPFWRAAQALDIDAMRLLREHGADPNVPTKKIPERRRRRPPADDPQEKAEDPTGLPEVPIGGPYVYPIHAAAGAGYGQFYMAHAHRHVPDNWLRAVRYLVEECGADVNLRDANGYTPLHHAAARGDNRMIDFLIEKGADVFAVSRKGQTTVDMANGPTQRVPPFPDTIALLESLGVKNNHQCVSC